MKTKYLISALALPALLAACVNDDFETQKQDAPAIESDLLKGRATGDLLISAVKSPTGEGASTRVDGELTEVNGIDWYWQPGDKLGAVVVDYFGVNYDQIVDADEKEDYVITNYPYEANIQTPATGATFSTPTAVVEGAYFFYNQYDGQNTSRRKIEHKLSQYITVKAGVENGLKQVGTDKVVGQNFFISPIAKVAVADGEALETPISLQSLYTVLNFKLTADVEDQYLNRGFSVNKIEVETSDGSNFKTAFVLNPLTLANVQLAVRDANKDAAWAKLIDDRGVIDATKPEANKDLISAAMQAVWNALQNPATLAECFSVNSSNDYPNKLVYQLETPFTWTQSNKDEVMELMVILPSDTYYENTTTKDIRDGEETGVLKFTVYTSEGVYKSYVIKGSNNVLAKADEYTFLRGKKANVSRTMKIKGDETNITLFDFTGEGFPVATTADWNYAIDYIKAHSRDFGDETTWQYPILNLDNLTDAEGKVIPIVVDAEHYFPNIRVKYQGDAVLSLEGQGEYVLDMDKMILGAGAKRPTVVIEDQPEATVSFDTEFAYAGTETDGVNYTDAVKLISDAIINIAADQKVNFDLLESNTALYVAEGATVTVYKSNTAKTAGTVTINATKENPATVTINGAYENAANVTVARYATLKTVGRATNDEKGIITVSGDLISGTFQNDGKLTIKSLAENMNDDSRGTATINTLTNNGVVSTEKGPELKGTFGGTLNVTSKLTNNAEVNINGVLYAKAVANNATGVITLEDDPYALIRVESTSTNKGKVVLTTPEEYEMYINYPNLDTTNKLEELADGVIEAELDNATYQEVVANHKNYNTTQETAWEIINKVIVTDKMALAADNLVPEKDFFLNDNASLDLAKAVEVKTLNANGKGAAVSTSAKSVVLTAENVNVPANTDLTVDEGVKVMVVSTGADFDEPLLNIAGTLTNNGQIDTEDGAAEANDIYTVISKGGLLKNNGKLSKDAVLKYNKNVMNKMTGLIAGLNNASTSDYRGTWGGNIPRVDLIEAKASNIVDGTADAEWNPEDTWKSNLNQSGNAVTSDVIKHLFAYGQLATVQGYQAIVVAYPTDTYKDSWSYVLYLGGPNTGNTEVVSESELTTWNAIATDTKAADENVDGLFANYAVQGTWFNVQNWGTLDLSAENSHAWGESEEMDRQAHKIGYFDNEK